MRMIAAIVAAGLMALTGGCMHLRGVVEEAPGRPSTTAILSVGRPEGVAVYSTHRVDAKGQFDFSMSMIDENNLYIYDGRGDPSSTLRRVDRSEMGLNMKLLVPPGRRDLMPDLP